MVYHTRNNRRKGMFQEQKAAAYLERQGYRILERNYRCRRGEIDLIGRDGLTLCFIEVKYRKNQSMGDPGESITPCKQQKIRMTALWYCMEKRIGDGEPCRFDTVLITGEEIRLLKDAF